MIFHSGILALLLGSGLTGGMLGYSAYQGIRIIRQWDISSGSERQLELERRTYLVSTVMSYALVFQLLSLFLFIYTADTLSSLFIGAMCAAGSLQVNGFGYPSLLLKIVSCLLAGLWLIVNAADNKAYDYPLLRTKYWLLLFIAPVLFIETTVQAMYLLGLRPDIITSCCSILFSTDADTLMSDLLVLPPWPSQIVFFSSALLTMALGLFVYLKTRGAVLYATVSLLHCAISITALISFIGIYIYELPTHHCPFCILHQEYGYIGYFLYAALLVGAITGIGTGVINPFRTIPSLHDAVPRMQKKLARISLIATLAFVLMTGWSILFSNLTLKAY